MEFKEFVREKRRMCKEILCFECPINTLNPKNNLCSHACLANPEEAEKIVSDWVSRNPRITNDQKLKEVLQDTFGEDYKEHILMSYSLSGWADKEYKEPGRKQND